MSVKISFSLHTTMKARLPKLSKDALFFSATTPRDVSLVIDEYRNHVTMSRLMTLMHDGASSSTSYAA